MIVSLKYISQRSSLQIGFKWDFKKSRKRKSSTSTEYDTQYALLLEFKNEYGHTKVNKLIKEWQKGEGEPSRKEFRRLPVFLTFVRKEYIAYVEGQPSSLDAEKVKQLEELGIEWKQPPSIPRKNTGGEISRKKKKSKIESKDQESYVAAELDVEAELPLLAATVMPTLPSPHVTEDDEGESTMI
jgi:hypothetical protein